VASWLVLALVVLAVLAAAWVYFNTRPEPAAATPAPQGQAFNWGGPGASAPSASAEAGPGALAAGPVSRPDFLSEEEWRLLQEGLADEPNREAELQRIVAYLGFKHKVDRWMALKDQPQAAERTAVGQEVLDALPAHYARQEVTAAEASLLQAAIYTDLVPDASQRQPLLQAAQARLQAAQAQDEALQSRLQQDGQRAQAWKRREAEITRRFSAGELNQEQFEKELDAARQAVFK